jgi:hypothetical protein
MSAKVCLIAVTLAAGCARPPAIDGADCPCPSAYHCDGAKKVCVANDTSPPTGAPPDSTNPSTAPLPSPAGCVGSARPWYLTRRLVRLSPVQLANAVADLTGYVFSPRELPDDVGYVGANLAIDVSAAGYAAVPSQQTVAVVADVARRAALALQPPASCAGPTLTADCTTYLHGLARRAYRRALADDETAELDANAAEGAALLGAEGAVRLAVEEMIQSPQFTYRPELGDVSAGVDVSLTGDELASELAFVLTDQPPDGPLLDAAPRLVEPAMLLTQSARLIATPASGEKTLRFLESLADIDRLADPPEGGPSLDLIADMQLETRSFLARVLDDGGDPAELFGADFTIVTPALASYYGATPDAGPGPYLTRIPERIGLLAQGSFLVAHAPGPSGLPSRRGMALAKMLFDSGIPAPPAGLPPVVPASELPARERTKQLVDQPACVACHALLDPLGLGLEQFDGAAHFRTTQGGRPIDTSISNYPQAPGLEFASSIDLARKVSVTPRGQDGLVSQYVEYVLGANAGCSLTAVSAEFLARGARIPALPGALAGSAAFTHRSNR